MIVIGADSHKRTHTVVALDAVGRCLAEKTVPTTSEGHLIGDGDEGLAGKQPSPPGEVRRAP